MNLKRNFQTSLQDHVIIDLNATGQTSTVENNSATFESVSSWISHNYCSQADIAINGTVNLDKLTSYLNFLEAKISASRKTITYWDAYNISQVAATTDELIQNYAKLPINNSLIITSDNVLNFEGRDYTRGDVLVKTADNQQVHVKHARTGAYKPDTIVKTTSGSNTYQLNFTYTEPAAPGTCQSVELPDDWKKSSDNDLSYDEGTLYNEELTIQAYGNGYVNAKKKTTNGPIIPVWLVYETYNGDDTSVKKGQRLFEAVQIEYQSATEQWVFKNRTPNDIIVVVR